MSYKLFSMPSSSSSSSSVRSVLSEKKKRLSTLKRRLSTLKKNASELSILCGIPVCIISFWPDGTVDTWPETRNEVKILISKYKHAVTSTSSNKSKKIKKPNLEAYKRKIVDPEKVINEATSNESLRQMLSFLDSKLKAVNDKIEGLTKIEAEKIKQEIESKNPSLTTLPFLRSSSTGTSNLYPSFSYTAMLMASSDNEIDQLENAHQQFSELLQFQNPF